MLVLTRRAGEVLRIDGDIRIVVVGVSGGQVRIGIDAPPERNVLREEVHARVAQANLAAAAAALEGPPGGTSATVVVDLKSDVASAAQHEVEA